MARAKGVAVFGIAIWLPACGSSEPPANAGSGSAQASVISCTHWHREPVPGTETVLINNTWNEAWAEAQPHSQCLLRRPSGTGDQYGWRWDWPQYKPDESYAAPEVLFGWKAWDGGVSTSSALPRRISDIAELAVDFKVELEADATHNLHTGMWITTSDIPTEAANIADIRNEIMVWFSDPADLGSGTYDGELTLGGTEFELWHTVNEPDASSGTTHAWTMLTYAAKSDQAQASFDLKLVLDDAVERGFVDANHAVGGVELISEVFGGSGELWIERFDVRVTEN